jgi:cysteamine dioxygenase
MFIFSLVKFYRINLSGFLIIFKPLNKNPFLKTLNYCCELHHISIHILLVNQATLNVDFLLFCSTADSCWGSKEMSADMGSRIEHLVRTALQTFALRPSGSFANIANIGELVQSLKSLASDITAQDIRLLVPNSGSPGVWKHDPRSGIAPVSYVGIFENKCVTVGVFVLKDGARIPIHDHQGMFGILKALYGNLSIRSYTPLKTTNVNTEVGLRNVLSAQKHPSKVITEKDDAVCLEPLDKNIHELWTVGGPAAFLDILAPPYNENGDNCFYYQEVITSQHEEDNCLLGRIPCPASFWCDSIQYTGPDLHHLYKL